MGDSGQTNASAASAGATPMPAPNYAGIATTAAGGVMKAYGIYQAGKYNRRVATINAKAANEQANQAREAGVFAENRLAIREHQVESADRAAAGSSGIVAGAGSNRNVIAANQATSAMDQLMIELNARREAYGFKARAAAATAEGRMASATAHQEVASTLLNTGNKLWQETHPIQPIID